MPKKKSNYVARLCVPKQYRSKNAKNIRKYLVGRPALN